MAAPISTAAQKFDPAGAGGYEKQSDGWPAYLGDVG
jgi:hypothetical protein